MSTTPRIAPTFNQIRKQIIDGITREYQNSPLDDKHIVEPISQAAMLAPITGISSTEYLRCAISGLTHAGAPRRVITAIAALYGSVILEGE